MADNWWTTAGVPPPWYHASMWLQHETITDAELRKELKALTGEDDRDTLDQWVALARAACQQCGHPVDEIPPNCRPFKCRNCGTTYPLGDCSD